MDIICIVRLWRVCRIEKCIFNYPELSPGRLHSVSFFVYRMYHYFFDPIIKKEFHSKQRGVKNCFKKDLAACTVVQNINILSTRILVGFI
jgi:hypothetical protein